MKTFARNRVVCSDISNPPRYYFVAKLELLENGMARVVGKKIDVTESVESLIANAKRRKK